MSRRLCSLLLLIALLWQSVGMLSPFTVAQHAQLMDHVVVHVQDVDHHHHADQSPHMEASKSIDAHQHADEGLTPAGLWPSAALQVPRLPPAGLAAVAAQPYIPPSLEGLLRPPTARA